MPLIPVVVAPQQEDMAMTDWNSGMRLTLSPNYHWSPGYTKDGMSAHIDYTGLVEKESAEIRQAFSANVGKLINEMNKRLKGDTGLKDVLKDFKTYEGRLTQAYRKVGFVGRDPMYARMHMTLALLARRFADRTQEIIATQSNGHSILQAFLVEEPFDTKVQALVEATFKLKETSTEHTMGSFLTSVQNGSVDIPSFVIPYSVLCSGSDKPQLALNRLAKEFSGGDLQVYELRIIFDDANTEPVEEVWKKLEPLAKSLASAEVELFTLMGTTNLADDVYAGHEKIASRILKMIAKSDGCKEMLRLNVSDCYVDLAALKAVAEIVGNSKVTSLKLSKLIPGVTPRSQPHNLELVMQDIGCGLGWKLCLGCQECGCPCCCGQMPDYPATINNLNNAIAQFNKQNEQLLQNCTATLVDIFESLRKNGIVDVVDMTGTHLPSLCKTVSGMGVLFGAIGKAAPTAVKLIGCGLTGAHTAALCQLFFYNKQLSHLEVSLCPCGSSESMENIQNLVESTPLLVTGSLLNEEPTTITVANAYETKESGGDGCCFPVKEVVHTQETCTYTLPNDVVPAEDFAIYNRKFQEETSKRLIIPWYFVIQQKFKGNKKKLTNLARAAKDPNYHEILSPEADEKKKKLFVDFLESVITADMDAMDMFDMSQTEEGYADTNAVMDGVKQKREEATALEDQQNAAVGALEDQA